MNVFRAILLISTLYFTVCWAQTFSYSAAETARLLKKSKLYTFATECPNVTCSAGTVVEFDFTDLIESHPTLSISFTRNDLYADFEEDDEKIDIEYPNLETISDVSSYSLFSSNDSQEEQNKHKKVKITFKNGYTKPILDTKFSDILFSLFTGRHKEMDQILVLISVNKEALEPSIARYMTNKKISDFLNLNAEEFLINPFGEEELVFGTNSGKGFEFNIADFLADLKSNISQLTKNHMVSIDVYDVINSDKLDAATSFYYGDFEDVKKRAPVLKGTVSGWKFDSFNGTENSGSGSGSKNSDGTLSGLLDDPNHSKFAYIAVAIIMVLLITCIVLCICLAHEKGRSFGYSGVYGATENPMNGPMMTRPYNPL